MMVSLQMQKVRTLKASLPTATQATSTQKPDIINLKVDRDGRVEMDQKLLSFPELATVLSNRQQINTNVPVYLSGSRDATHAAVMYALDFVKHAGIQQVAIAIKPESNQPGE
jgi:biopolymer transport protein ExbD